MKILEINSYKDNGNRVKVFFITTVTFKYVSSYGLFKSEVPADYYTTELTRALKP